MERFGAIHQVLFGSCDLDLRHLNVLLIEKKLIILAEWMVICSAMPDFD